MPACLALACCTGRLVGAAGCRVSPAYISFCSNPGRDKLTEDKLVHYSDGYQRGGMLKSATAKYLHSNMFGKLIHTELGLGMALLVFATTTFLFIVLSATSIAKLASDDDQHRRGETAFLAPQSARVLLLVVLTHEHLRPDLTTSTHVEANIARRVHKRLRCARRQRSTARSAALLTCADVHTRPRTHGRRLVAGAGGARRVVGGGQQQTRNPKLETWSRFGAPMMLFAIVTFVYGTIQVITVMGIVIHVKGIFPHAEGFCRLHGWRFVDRDPETDVPRCVATLPRPGLHLHLHSLPWGTAPPRACGLLPPHDRLPGQLAGARQRHVDNGATFHGHGHVCAGVAVGCGQVCGWQLQAREPRQRRLWLELETRTHARTRSRWRSRTTIHTLALLPG